MSKLAKIHGQQEPVWHIQIALLVAIFLQFFLDHNLTVGHRNTIVILELVLVLILFLVRPGEIHVVTRIRRTLAIVFIALLSLANITSLILVINDLFNPGVIHVRDLILSALSIYITNIILFGFWYWELDSDNPEDKSPPDFLFPQNTIPNTSKYKEWKPSFFDYFYLSVNNALAFSSNDTVPLTHRAKFLTVIQSGISLTIIALVVTRAISIMS